MKLTNKQSTFCDEYVIDLNATQAAIRAGYSEHTASAIGKENLRKPPIANRIQEMMDKRSASTEITAANVLKHIAKHAYNEDCNAHINLKALEMLSKNLNLFQAETIEANINITIANYGDDDNE